MSQKGLGEEEEASMAFIPLLYLINLPIRYFGKQYNSIVKLLQENVCLGMALYP